MGSAVSRHSSTVPTGDALSTSPAAGYSVPAGTKVTLYVSSGPAPIAVPNVVGDTEAAAKAELTGFKVTTTTRKVSNASKVGSVIAQTPSGGKALPDSTVALVIGAAPTTATVPNVTGDTAQAAERQLKGAGFKVVKQRQAVTRQDRGGIVLSESPSAGSKQQKGSTVTIVVGKYRKPSGTNTRTTTTTTTTTTITTPTSTSIG